MASLSSRHGSTLRIRSNKQTVSQREAFHIGAGKAIRSTALSDARFGQFLQAILALSTEAGDDEPVWTSLIRLRNQVEAFLTKMGKGIADSRKKERFLYNNYSLVLTIIGDLDGKLALEQQQHFESLKKAFGEIE